MSKTFCYFTTGLSLWLLAGFATALPINLDQVWLEQRNSDETSIYLRDINALGAKYRARFNWNPGTNKFDLDTSSAKIETANPLRAQVDSWHIFDAQTGVISQQSLFWVFGYKVTGASVTTPDGSVFSFAYHHINGTRRAWRARDTTGFPVTGPYAFVISDGGSIQNRTVTLTSAATLPLFSNVVIQQQGNGLAVSFDPIVAPVPLNYRVRISNRDIGEWVFDRFYDVTTIFVSDVQLAPGENFEVRIDARTKDDPDDNDALGEISRDRSRYDSAHLVWQ